MEIRHNRILLLILILLIIVSLPQDVLALSKNKRAAVVLMHRVFDYARAIDKSYDINDTTYSYVKYSLNIKKKNPIMLAVPSMWYVAYGKKRKYVGEIYSRTIFRGLNDFDAEDLIDVNTIPHNHKSMDNVTKYLTPDVYGETMVQGNILSPFHLKNRRFYKYMVEFLKDGTCRIYFHPKRDNTQLVEGQSIVETATGRIISVMMIGEFDMIRFTVGIEMGSEGIHSLFPSNVNMNCQFRFLGNKTDGVFKAVYGIKKYAFNGEKTDLRSLDIMNIVRPIALSEDEAALYANKERDENVRDSIRQANSDKKPSQWKAVFWDVLGDNMVNRIKSKFGKNNEGYLRINPILNPLYMGYDHRRGFTYKFDLRLAYMFTPNRLLSTRFKAGYSFKQSQLYYTIPTYFYYNKRRNGYILLEIGNGNWIRNGIALDKAREQVGDSVISKHPRAEYFKDRNVKLANNYDISDNWGFQAGFIYHKRIVVDHDLYRLAQMPTHYISMAPFLEIQWRPRKWAGPFINLDYERAIKGFMGGDIKYERIEIDGQWAYHLTGLQTINVRTGSGFYTVKDGDTYFLDYSNFRENNIPGGWNDDWSGEFELLDSRKYNESMWYGRANVTYESPLLAISWIPMLGRCIEMERIYASSLISKNCRPYVELGYGFTTRLFSMGLFMSNDSGKFKSFGCKFGFELFRHW